MENIINRIIEIDKNATERLNAAESRKKSVMSDTSLERANLRESAIKDAEQELAKKDKAAKDNVKNQLDSIAAGKQEAIDRLTANYNANHEKWEGEIFNRIVGE